MILAQPGRDIYARGRRGRGVDADRIVVRAGVDVHACRSAGAQRIDRNRVISSAARKRDISGRGDIGDADRIVPDPAVDNNVGRHGQAVERDRVVAQARIDVHAAAKICGRVARGAGNDDHVVTAAQVHIDVAVEGRAKQCIEINRQRAAVERRVDARNDVRAGRCVVVDLDIVCLRIAGQKQVTGGVERGHHVAGQQRSRFQRLNQKRATAEIRAILLS